MRSAWIVVGRAGWRQQTGTRRELHTLGGYTYDVDQVEHTLADMGVAEIFMHSRSQTVRLPLAFRLPGNRVRVRCAEGGILLEPTVTDLDTWSAEIDRFADVPFMEDSRRKPPMSEPKDPFA